MELQRQSRLCSLQQRRIPLVLRCSLLAVVFCFAMLSLSCHAAAARPLNVAYTDEFVVITDGRNSKTFSEWQESDHKTDAYQVEMPKGSQFLMRGVYLKEEVPADGRKLPPTPPIVHGFFPPCPAPPPPEEYLKAKEDAEGKKEERKTKKEEKHAARGVLDCEPIL